MNKQKLKMINQHNENVRKSKTRRIIDCFIFYNEIEMINYRLNVLNNIVDFFIIVESTHTFSGREKKMYSDEVTELFDKFKDKIVHIIVDDMPFKYPNINFNNNEQWKNEIHQRNCIKRGLDKLHIFDEDFIIIADTDEIPDPRTLQLIKNNTIPVFINILELDIYYYNLNTKDMKNHEVATKIVLYRIFKEKNLSCHDYRGLHHELPCPRIKNGGWHMSYFGDKYFIKNKIENFSHQELNNEQFTNLNKIEERIKNCNDLYDRDKRENSIKFYKIPISKNNYLPLNYDLYLRNFYNEYI